MGESGVISYPASGILLSGSRSVFVLTAAVLLVLAWRRREYRRFNIAILRAALLLGGVYSFATGTIRIWEDSSPYLFQTVR